MLYSQWVSWLWQKNARLGLLSNLFNHHFKCSECVGVFFFKYEPWWELQSQNGLRQSGTTGTKIKLKKQQQPWTENLADNSNSVKSFGIWPNCSFFTYASDRVRLFTRPEDSMTLCVYIHIYIHPSSPMTPCVCVCQVIHQTWRLYDSTHVCVYIHTHTHTHTSILPSPQKIKK